MAQPPAHDESINNPPSIPLETRVPDKPPTNGDVTSEQSSAPVGPQAPTRSAECHLDSEARKGDSPATIADPLPATSPPASNGPLAPETSTRSGNGHSESGTIPSTVQAASVPPPQASSRRSKQRPKQNRRKAATGCTGTSSCTCRNCIEAEEAFATSQPFGAPIPTFNPPSDQISAPVDAALGSFNAHPNTFGYGPAEAAKRSCRKGGQKKAITARKPQTPKQPPPTLSPEETFYESLRNLRPGSEEFIKTFLLGEAEFFKNSGLAVNVHENGHEFVKKVRNLTELHLVKDKDGLGMKAPAGLTRKTVPDYVSRNEIIGINYSANEIGAQLADMKVGELLDNFEIPPELRENFINSIAFECSDTDLGKKFQEPEFVWKNGIIQKLKILLQKLPQDKDVKESLRMMPKYTKFLIMSMARSFTDVHFDFSGSSVFYHVFEGQKVFYVAPHNKENLEQFMRYQRKQSSKEGWIGSTMGKQWKRIVINAGQTAFIPGGHLHFVYTPVDSLVIGGNFLMEKDIELGFKCTKHEEDLLAPYPQNPTKKDDNLTRSALFQGFRSTMWAYVEHILLPRLRESKDDEFMALAKIFVADSRKKQWPLGLKEWYSEEKRTNLLLELKKMLGISVRKRKEKATTVNGDEQEASTSAASDAKRSQKAPSKRTMKKDKDGSLEEIEGNGSEDTAQPESSSTSLPPAELESKNLKRKQPAPRRPANPSTSAAANWRGKGNKMMDSMEEDQEEKKVSSQELSTSSYPAPISKGMKTQPCLSTSATAPKRQKQADVLETAVPQQLIDDSIKKPNPKNNDDAEKMKGLEDSQPQSGIVLDSDTKGSGPVEKQVDNVEKMNEEIPSTLSLSVPVLTPKQMNAPSYSSTSALALTLERQNRGDTRTTSDSEEKESGPVEEQMEAVQKENVENLKEKEEVNYSISTTEVLYHSNEDDYDTGSHTQQPMDSDPVDDRMEVDEEKNDENLSEKKESTPVRQITSSGSMSTAHTEENDAGRCVPPTPTFVNGLPPVAEADATKEADKEDHPTSTAADAEKEESIPTEDQEKVDQAKKDTSLKREKESTEVHQITSSGSLSPVETNEEDGDARSHQSAMLPITGLDESDARKDENQPILTAVDSEKEESIPTEDQVEVGQEKKDASFEGEKESTPAHSSTLFGSTSPANTNDDVGSCSLAMLASITGLDESNARKNANEEDHPTSTPADFEKEKSIPTEDQDEVDQGKKDTSFEEEHEIAQEHDPILPPCSGSTSSKNTTMSVLNYLPIPQQNEAEVRKALEIVGEKLTLAVLDPKTKEPEQNRGKITEVHEVQEKCLEEQESTPNENILPSHSSKVPETLAAAPTISATLPSVSATDHPAHKQSMPTSPELLPRRETSSIALLLQDQPSQPRELVAAQTTSLLKTKRQALSAIVMQDLDDTQLTQIATLLHSPSVSVPTTQNLQNSADIAESSQNPVRKDKGQVENKEMAATNNNEVVDSEKEKKQKQPTSSMASDPAKEKKDQVGQEEVSSPSIRASDAALRKNALYSHTLLHNKIASLSSVDQVDVCHGMSLLLMVVGKFVPLMVQEEVPPSSTAISAADVLDQHYLLIKGIDSLSTAKRRMAYEILATQMTIVQKLVEDKQEHSRGAPTVEAGPFTMVASHPAQLPMEQNDEEKRKKRTAAREPSPEEPATKRTKLSSPIYTL